LFKVEVEPDPIKGAYEQQRYLVHVTPNGLHWSGFSVTWSELSQVRNAISKFMFDSLDTRLAPEEDTYDW
jgi:hypothetical protein